PHPRDQEGRTSARLQGARGSRGRDSAYRQVVRDPSVVIRLAVPDLSAGDIQRAVEVLNSGNLIQGAAVGRFEQALTEYTGVPCAVVSSGTAALHLALIALDIGPGDAVLVPAFTFPATANAVERVGAKTVLCDVDPTTYVSSASGVEQALTA